MSQNLRNKISVTDFFSRIWGMRETNTNSKLERDKHQFKIGIDCSALHRASNFNFFRVRFSVDGRGAAAGLGLVEDRHDFEAESTTRKMQVGKKGKELKGRNCEKVPSPARCALRTSSTRGTT